MGEKFNNRTIFKKLTAFILNFDIGNTETNDNITYPCPTCDKVFNAKLGGTQHQRQTQDCNIIYILGKFCLKNAPPLDATHSGQLIKT